MSRVIYVFPKRHLVPRLCVVGAARNFIPLVDSDRFVHSDRPSLVGFGTYPYSSFFDVGLIQSQALFALVSLHDPSAILSALSLPASQVPWGCYSFGC
jgi:hypothetical protein